MDPVKLFRHCLVQSLLVTVILLAAYPLMAATNVKLSGTMPSFGDVRYFQISPDSRYAVYMADQDTDGVLELYSVRLGVGNPNRLNPLLPTGKKVASFLISPDSNRVVYRADLEIDGVIELYSVPIGGMPADGVKLNGILVAGGQVSYKYQISPDSLRVVYLADQQTDGVDELYSVPIGGPKEAGVKLNKTLVLNGGISTFQISPDSKLVVYQADQERYLNYELFSVPIEGPAAVGVKLNDTLVRNGGVNSFQISSDSSRVVYRADQQTDNVRELYSVPTEGPATAGVKLNGSLVLDGNVSIFQISPDSSRVIYRADQRTDEVDDLYSVPIKGPAADGIKLNGSLVLNGNIGTFQISPDSSRVVYPADQQTDEVTELYSVPIGGPAANGVKLNGPIVIGGGVKIFKISEDSSRVVYLANQDTDGVFELYSVPIEGPAADGIKLNGSLVLNGMLVYKADAFQVSEDSSRVVYLADQDTDGVFELYSVPIGGPATSGVKLNGPLVVNGDVSSFQISKDSGRIIYNADQNTDEIIELYMISDYHIYLPLIL